MDTLYKRSEVIRTLPQLKRLARKMSSLREFAFDTETNTLRVYGENKNFKLVGMSISWGDYNNYYIPTGHIFDGGQLSPRVVAKYLKPIFENPDIRLIGHNLKFDMHVLERIGIYVKTNDLIDTAILSWICDENLPKGLKDNSVRILGLQQEHFADTLASVSVEEKKSMGLKGNQKATFDMVRIDIATPYALADSHCTWKIYLYYLDKVVEEEMDKIFYKTYPQFTRTLFNMESRGIDVDIPKLKTMGVAMQKDLEELEYDMLEIAGTHIELSSTQKVGYLLFGIVPDPPHPKETKDFRYLPQAKQDKKIKDYEKKLVEVEELRKEVSKYTFGFPVVSTTATGKPQVTNDVVHKLLKSEYKNKRKREGLKFCELYLEYAKLSKLKSAFVDGLLEQLYDDGKAHPSFNIVGTDSGRISCSSPNLMQMPNAEDDDKYKIREVFIGTKRKDGKRNMIISVDYSNLEVRVIAHFSQDEGLLKAFADGVDLHGNTAKMMFRLDCHPNEVKKKFHQLRQQGKVIAFLLQYGGGASTLYEDLNKDGSLDKIANDVKNFKGSKLPSELAPFKGCKKGIEVAQRLMDMYFEGFPGIAKFMKHQKKIAHRQGYINTLVGRKRRLPDIYSNNYGIIAYNERLSINACIQGSGADIMINAQNRLEGTNPCRVSTAYAEEHGTDKFIASDRLKELDCNMLVQIHDELLFDCPEENCEEAIGIIRDCMINPFGEKVKLNLELEVGAGFSENYQGGH